MAPAYPVLLQELTYSPGSSTVISCAFQRSAKYHRRHLNLTTIFEARTGEGNSLDTPKGVSVLIIVRCTPPPTGCGILFVCCHLPTRDGDGWGSNTPSCTQLHISAHPPNRQNCLRRRLVKLTHCSSAETAMNGPSMPPSAPSAADEASYSTKLWWSKTVESEPVHASIHVRHISTAL